jgi:hypothetical protein
LIIHIGGACKKDKVQKTPPEYTIIEDDADLMVKKFHEGEVEDFEDARDQRDRI